VEKVADSGIFLLMCIFVALEFVHVIFLLRRAKASLEWLPTKGVIVGSQVLISYKCMKADIQYGYIVGGIEYVNDKRGYGLGNEGYKSKKIVERYCVGREVTVCFCPQKPKRAVLEPGRHRGIYTGLIFSIVLLIALLVSKSL
jgi:hypothetical protein